MYEDIDIMADDGVAAALKEFEWVLTAPLDELVVPELRVLPDADRVRGWRLPEADRDALIRWGLPANDRGLWKVDFQDSAGYELVALSDDSRIVADAGTVLWQPGPPVDMEATAEFWERNPGFLAAVRQRNPDFPHVEQAVANSSVALFVETSWRYERAVRALLTLPTATAEPFEVACADALHDCLDVFLVHLRSLDPPAVESRHTFWPDVVEDW